MMQLLQGLLGGGAPAAPTAKPEPKPAEQKPAAPAAPVQAQAKNPEHAPAAVAMSQAKPEVAAQAQAPVQQKAVEEKPDEKQGLLMKAIESIAKTFGVDMQALTKLLLKANPQVAEEAVKTALQAALPQQASAKAAPAAA